MKRFEKGDTVWTNSNAEMITTGKIEEIAVGAYYVRCKTGLYYKLPEDIFKTKQEAIDYFKLRDIGRVGG
jgi:hypothetical protein